MSSQTRRYSNRTRLFDIVTISNGNIFTCGFCVWQLQNYSRQSIAKNSALLVSDFDINQILK